MFLWITGSEVQPHKYETLPVVSIRTLSLNYSFFSFASHKKMQLPWTFRFTITVEEYTNKMGQTSLNVMIENSFFIDVYLWDNII